MTELRFDGRVAVVTGGGRGLGRAYAMSLASRGARVVINDTGGSRAGTGLDATPAEETARAIVAAGGDAVACLESVATPEGGEAIIEAAMKRYGRIDILIHSAGNVRWGGLDEITPADFDSVLDVHLRGAFHVVRAAFPLMHKAGYGRVVLTSSITGLYGDPRLANYAAAKAGMIGLSNVIALEGHDVDIKSNIILPGALTRMADGLDTTQMPPMTPEMVAPVVAWLSHESCTLTGEMFIAIGGRVARAFIGESRGVFRDAWTIEEVAYQMSAIRDVTAPLTFVPIPTGQIEHIQYMTSMRKAAMGS
jgi:NAD(P)-dependent dehydrogenase (short-subunit alcohol dehydrogenase family)